MRPAVQNHKAVAHVCFRLSRKRKPKCDKGYVLRKTMKANSASARQKVSNERHSASVTDCSASASYNADKEEPLYDRRTNASRVDKIMSVRSLMQELTGKVCSPVPPDPGRQLSVVGTPQRT